MSSKAAQESRVTTSRLMMPEHANHMGFVHGGVIMRLADETAALSAMRHTRHQVVTRAIDSMTFNSPVHVGDLVTLHASVNWVGRTSIEVGVKVIAENPLTGEQTHTNTAYFVYVAVDEAGQPAQVAPLLLETDEDRKRWAEAATRRARRISGQDKKDPEGE